MEFEEILKRADINSLRAFIMTGLNGFPENSNLSYSEKTELISRNIHNILKGKNPSSKELDVIEGAINEQMFALENVYFEMGMLAGAKITLQILKKLKDI